MQGGPPRLEDSKWGDGHEVKSVVEGQEQISCRALSLDTWPAVETLKKKKRPSAVLSQRSFCHDGHVLTPLYLVQ